MEGEKEVVPFGEDRSALYAQALVDGSEQPEEEQNAEVKTDAETETQEEKFSAEPPVIEEAEEVKEVKEEKTVPYGALKEEREKRKAAQKQIDELQDRLQNVLSDFQNYVKKDSRQPEEPAVIEDYDKEIIDLKKVVQRQTDELKALRGNFQSEQQKMAKAEFDKRLDAVDSDLLKEGYPGFNQFIGHVKQVLSQIAEEDMDEAKSLDNPEGWKRIYKERVFDNLSTIFTKKQLADKR
ncbi:MAG: hypothetical protein WCX48_10940, partial [Bacteroidales bacterium]